MKKNVIISVTLLSIVFFSSCNSKNTDTAKESITEVVTEKPELVTETNSDETLSFTFNGESFKNDISIEKQSAGMRTKGDNWLLGFNGLSKNKEKEVSLQFKIEKFNLEKGVISVPVCTLSLVGFEDSEIKDVQLYARDNVFLEITSVKKTKSESAMGTTMEEYIINGKFHGDFKNITGDKSYKVENGSFENSLLVDIKRS